MAILLVYSSIVSICASRDADGRNHAGRVAGMDAGQFDVLHDRRNKGVRAVRDCVRLGFDGIFQELIDQNRPVGRDAHGRGDIHV